MALCKAGRQQRRLVVIHLRRRWATKVELTQDQYTVQLAVTKPAEQNRKKATTAKTATTHKQPKQKQKTGQSERLVSWQRQ